MPGPEMPWPMRSALPVWTTTLESALLPLVVEQVTVMNSDGSNSRSFTRWKRRQGRG